MIDECLLRMREQDVVDIIKQFTESKTVLYIWQQDNFNGEEIIAEHYIKNITAFEFYQLKYHWRHNKMIKVAPYEEDKLFYEELLRLTKRDELRTPIQEILTIHEIL